MTAPIGVLLDKSGNFLDAKDVSDNGELVPVPCTIESKIRTSGDAPHVINDNLSYVGNFPKYQTHYNGYIEQLRECIKSDIGRDDEYAIAVYNYIKHGTLYNDIADVLDGRKWPLSKDKVNIVFAVYGLENEDSDHLWTEYYAGEFQSRNSIISMGRKF